MGTYKKSPAQRAFHKNRMLSRQHRWRAAGCCVDCGTPTEINPLTKKHFVACFEHKLLRSNRNKRYYKKHAERLRPIKRDYWRKNAKSSGEGQKESA